MLKNDWKLNHFSQYREAIETIQSHGITVNGCFIIGLDEHTPEIFDQVFEFVKETGLYEVQVTVQTPFPGTPLYARLAAEGRLLYPKQWERCTLFDVNYQPKNMSVKELRDGTRKVAKEFYSIPNIIKRNIRIVSVVKRPSATIPAGTNFTFRRYYKRDFRF